ncbi:MAG: hypothetical protein KGJ89_01085 [Patescibacteria group bacterium]|nr:hypothetical protein [Patescibacteria group bacterium]MDE2015107.1 hypothetical protein [Patescibacteria group bacterium]MDE2226535.1 hypothetical protein [Patescibacteria group bacterium]
MLRDEFEKLRGTLVSLVGDVNFLFKNNQEVGNRRGGYFCLADGNGKPFFEPTQIGEVAVEKAEKYMQLCKEKAQRLASRPLIYCSSYESRNPEAGQWGGAIRLTNDHIFSFSGFPELLDEALMIILAETYYGKSAYYVALAEGIADRSNNHYYRALTVLLRPRN